MSSVVTMLAIGVLFVFILLMLVGVLAERRMPPEVRDGAREPRREARRTAKGHVDRRAGGPAFRADALDVAEDGRDA